jgi:hypothetical protein
MMADASENVRLGMAKRNEPAEDFRLGNFWAWHIKKDREASMYEARRELIWRGAVIGKEEDILRKYTHGDDELNIIMDNWENFRKACWTRSGNIEGVPEDLVNRMIAGMSSAGDMQNLDSEIERFRQFKEQGLTELSLRLHDDPMEALELIGEHVLPALR